MTAVYEALLRHPDLLDSNTLILGAGAEMPAAWLAYVEEHSLTYCTWDLLTAQAYADETEFTEPHTLLNKAIVPDVNNTEANTVILLWPKSKVFGQALIQLLSQQHSQCYVIAANDAGGKSIQSATKELVSGCKKIDSARRCSLWFLQLETSSERFNWLQHARSFTFEERSFLTLPGVFNHGKLDVGTELLLEHVPAPAQGKLLDVGCGSGVIGLTMKARNLALHVTLSDIDAMAIKSAQLNALRLGLEAEVVSSNGLQNIDGHYDYIFSNPPFHQGKHTDYHFASALFEDAKRHLTRDGQLWIVANRHLPYEEWARESFASAEILAQEKGFKLICAQQR
ncbi:MAG: class I SAM-dependent methyltransferase [Oleibacter sp.]|nr:class I SAM-dependent methyltransferase [Thalassolituus sp.]